MHANNIQYPKNLNAIDIEVAKILAGGKHKRIFDVYRNIIIPDNDHDDADGKYVQLNITDLVSEWFHSQDTSHDISIKIMSSTADQQQLPHRFIALNSDDIMKVI